jgi:Phage tail tube protein
MAGTTRAASSPATAVTGKRFTIVHGTKDGSAQCTSASISQSASSETIQTLGGSVAISQGVETTISAEFLYDGDQAGGGFYATMNSALASGTAATLTITGSGGTAGETWSGQVIVTSLGVELPADGAVTCSAEFAISGALTFTASTP